MTNAFDPDWPHGHLMGGKPARIICTDAKSEYPIVALVHDGIEEFVETFTHEGRYNEGQGDRSMDLINAPAPKRRVKGWIALRESITGPRDYPLARVYITREQALAATRYDCLAVFEFDVEEGEGL